MYQRESNSSPFRESIKTLEADMHHANTLAAALPKDYGGDSIKMKLSYSPFAPLLLFLIDWLDYSCTDTLPTYLGLLHILVYKVYLDGIPIMSSKERKATIREFYDVIYPSLKQLEGDFAESLDDETKSARSFETPSRDRADEEEKDNKQVSCIDVEKDDECGICMENCPKMVLPNCGHSMCITCFRDWNARSQSCPFCRGCLKRVKSGDLWVLTTENDAIDMITLAKENLKRFYLYIESLPFSVPDTHFVLYEYMI